MTGKVATILVTLAADAESRAVIEAAVGTAAHIVYLSDLAVAERGAALQSATVLLSRQTGTELRAGEHALIGNARLVQFVTAGVDYIRLNDLPPNVPLAANGGAFAEPMAEHAVAMALAAFKRLFVEHAKLAAGTFDQFRQNRMLAGSVCGILGFGGIGIATARAMRALGARIYAVNRSGRLDEPTDWIGPVSALPHLLASSDILVVCTPLTPATRGLIGRRELAVMKPDAVLVNLARGEIIDEADLYAHLEATPTFTACIDAWWIEPIRHGTFRMDHDFTRLPNVIASPHNSASVAGTRVIGLERAVANIRRVLDGGEARHIVAAADRMM